MKDCEPGLVTNPSSFCWHIAIKDQWKKSELLQTHNQGLRQLLISKKGLSPLIWLDHLYLAPHS